jgi:hypothetical protein
MMLVPLHPQLKEIKVAREDLLKHCNPLFITLLSSSMLYYAAKCDNCMLTQFILSLIYLRSIVFLSPVRFMIMHSNDNWTLRAQGAWNSCC